MNKIIKITVAILIAGCDIKTNEPIEKQDRIDAILERTEILIDHLDCGLDGEYFEIKGALEFRNDLWQLTKDIERLADLIESMQ